MAAKSNKYNKNEKKNYLTPDIINKVSDIFNSAIFARRTFDAAQVKEATLNAWSLAKEKLSEGCQASIIREADEKITSSFESSADLWIDTVNSALNQYRRQSDASLTSAKIDLFKLWHNIAYGERTGCDIPWLRSMELGEKFMPYFSNEERYILKGFTNQAILAFAVASNKVKDADSIIVFKKDLETLLSHDFQVDADSKKSVDDQKKSHILNKLKGNNSITSLFVPTTYEQWVTADGQPWHSEDGSKKPSADIIIRDNLKIDKAVSFVSQPVWSVSSIKHLISADANAKLESLIDVRKAKSDFVLKNEDKDLDKIIDALIDSQVHQHSIEINESGNSAFYKCMEDSISIPSKAQFINPVARYAVWAHELTHSTMHLLERRGINKFGTVPYAKEEIVAESCAHLLVKDLEEKLTTHRNGALSEEWSKYFSDYYQNAADYGASHGAKFDFAKQFEQLQHLDFEHRKLQILPSMMGDVLNAMTLIKTGLINEQKITPEVRNQALRDNIAKNYKTPEPGLGD